VALIVFTAVIGMFLAVPGIPPWKALVFGNLGIWLAASSAAAINHLLDRRIDEKMARTSHRPLPSGSLSGRQVFLFALILGTLSMLLLCVFVNWLTAVLTFFSLIGYAVIYTVYLKHATPQNIVIGGAAGAAPPVLGWAAVHGWPAGASFAALFDAPLDYGYALLLFLIIFVWTPPHFWALAIFRREDYARAMVPMLPVTHGVQYTRWQILFYTILLVLVTLLPWFSGMSGVFYLGGVLVLDAVFLYYAIRLMNPPNEAYAMKVFGYSIWYLMVLFAFLLIDHWIMPHNQI
jgi:protoheme IX farnesyltransferase